MGTLPGVVRSLTLILVATAALTRSSASGESAGADSGNGVQAREPLLLEFDVAPGNRLYVNGERIEHVRLALSPGDSLRLDGVAIMPPAVHAQVENIRISDEQLATWYGEVPYVQARLAEGKSIAVATELYETARLRVSRLLRRAYATARREGASKGDAGIAALSQLRAIDRDGLLDWTRGPTVAGSEVTLVWEGIEPEFTVMLSSDSYSAPDPASLDEERWARARSMYDALAIPHPCWCFTGAGGYRMLCGEQMASRLSAELARVLATGDVREARAMGESTAREILARQSEATGLPN